MASRISGTWQRLTEHGSQKLRKAAPKKGWRPEMGDQEEDYSALPLTDRFGHKVWKVRKQAYEDAAKEFEKTPDESDPAFKPFLQDSGLWKGAVADSNVAAQQEGINSLCSFLKYGGTQACTRTRGVAVTPIVEKGLSSTRAATKAGSLEALLLFIELDKPDPIIEDLLPNLSHKQPKIIAATLSALTSIFHAYGTKTVDPKPVLKALTKVFGHADKNVRAESQSLAVELYRWLREAMKPMFWADLKPVQQQDLEALFEKVKQEPSPKQERLLRSQEAAKAKSSASGPKELEEAEDEEEEDGVVVDAFDLAEPQDVMSKVPEDLHDQLGSTKWKDRKDALDALYAIINVPRIKDGHFDEIVRALAKSMKDANIAVVTVAANCVDVLAKGLRHGFGKYRSIVMAPMMERLKEKKQSVADAIGQALDSVFASTSLADCLEETIEFLKHKNPQVKLESLRFLIRCLKTTREAPSKAETKSIADAATKLLTESTEVTRSGGAEILGTLMKIMGERQMNPYLDGLDDIRKTKIKEYFDAAEVKAKDKPKPAAPPPKAAAAPATQKKKMFGQKAAAASATKKPPPPFVPPNEDSPASAPLHSKPTSRSIPSKLGAPRSGLAAPTGGLKLQKKLGGPSGVSAPSPKRPVQTPTSDDEEAARAPKLGLGGRGLAGRPLGKPAAASVAPEPASALVSPGLGPAERAELEALRADKDRLLRTNDDLRTEKSKLNSQIHELQNQNAQLIEDHTRDVLSIKAKETQLVRARTDAEVAEQTCQRQQKEIDRLKRELGRAIRSSSPAPSDHSDRIYRDLGPNGGGRPDNNSEQASRQGSRPPMSRAISSFSSPSEEKENGGPDSMQRGKLSPPRSISTGGKAASAITSREQSTDRAAEPNANGDGAEIWRRAAEVTSQLKARIEQMKARQGLKS
ncbi:MAG: Microtubule-associated protein, microtubule dynamics during spindle orientation [Candelina submexicana]|nr:MAG: Microtubule-associated protein, microtubule dynamics during spindle orientation [Candelina submexicana]